MNHRLRMHGLPGGAIQGSMLECPLGDASMDFVVSIGCFHHTGDVQRCIDEAWRVLKPGGAALLMVYNRFSYRQWSRWPLVTAKALLAQWRRASAPQATQAQRAAYDTDQQGVAAPVTSFHSTSELRLMLQRFREVALAKENCEAVHIRGRVLVGRQRLLPLVGPLAGLDIYIKAVR
jgi:ubiquinone/menaquinone biosynthesis C-methylase UbiE